jgi:hypothetical protein
MPPASVELYVSALTTSPFADLSLLTECASTWVRDSDRFPTVHQLTDGYQAAARRRMEDRRMAEQQRAINAGMLPGVGIDPGYAVEMVDVMREALAVLVGKRTHDHSRGAERCPTCSIGQELALSVELEARRIVAERGLRPPQVVETYACAECCDTGFVITDVATGTTRPCRNCSPAAHERWIDGHLMPGHDCPDCRDVRRGR